MALHRLPLPGNWSPDIIAMAGYDGADFNLIDTDSEGRMKTVGYHWNTSTLAFEVNTGGTTTGADVNVTNFPASYLVTNDNLDVALSTRLKPSDTLTKVSTIDTITNEVTVKQGTAAPTASLWPTTLVDSDDHAVDSDHPLFTATKIVDTSGAAQGISIENGCIRQQGYGDAISEGDILGHEVWDKVGFTPAMTTSISDVWSAGGLYVPPVSGIQMGVYSSNNVDDIGTAIFSGAATGGSSTTLVDTGKNFTAGTAVAIGDCILLDSLSSFGFVTGVSATTLTVADGFYGAVIPVAGSTYRVVDKSATAGAQAARVEFLDSNYSTFFENILFNGTTQVNSVTTDGLRVNSFRVIAAGANGIPTGNLSLRNTAGTVTYSYITAGYTRARNSFYTVPAGKTLYIKQINAGYGYSTNQTHYARLILRATQYKGFKTPGVFHAIGEEILANNSTPIYYFSGSKIVEKVDVKASGISTFLGIATIAMRGWLE